MLYRLIRLALARACFQAGRRLAPELDRPEPSAWPLERLALRQQLAVFKHDHPRPRLRPRDRLFWVTLRRAIPEHWGDNLHIVSPDTVVRWHRAGYRLYWRLRSGKHRPGGGRPAIAPEVRALIDRMASENGYGATRIHGELLRLGFCLSEKTVSNYLKRRFPYPENRMAQWRAFLRNEAVAAMDFAVVPTAGFRHLYALVIIEHGRRRLLHANATENPSAGWVAQQLREAFPGDQPLPRYLIHDRDATFCSATVQDTIRNLGIRPCPTTIHCPWQNGVCERFIGTLRKELLRKVVVLNDRHLHRLLLEYQAYYNGYRTHLTLNKDSPDGRSVQPRPVGPARVVSIPHLGGLHHHYEWAARPNPAFERLAA